MIRKKIFASQHNIKSIKELKAYRDIDVKIWISTFAVAYFLFRGTRILTIQLRGEYRPCESWNFTRSNCLIIT